MNPIEDKLYVTRGMEYWPLYDAMLVAAWLEPAKIVRRQVLWNCDVELYGRDTRGMVAIDHSGSGQTVPNVNMIEEIDHESLRQIMLWALSPVTTEAETVLVN